LNGPFSFDRTTFKAGNTMTERFAQITYEALPAEVRPLADDILKVSSAALGGPYNALLRSPEMARRAFDFLDSALQDLGQQAAERVCHPDPGAHFQRAVRVVGARADCPQGGLVRCGDA
jgi:hypothetical protein